MQTTQPLRSKNTASSRGVDKNIRNTTTHKDGLEKLYTERSNLDADNEFASTAKSIYAGNKAIFGDLVELYRPKAVEIKEGDSEQVKAQKNLLLAVNAPSRLGPTRVKSYKKIR